MTTIGPVLWIAAQDGKLSDVRKLITCGGVDLEVTSGVLSSSSLHLAAKNGHLMVVIVLLDNGCNIDFVDRDGWTALHYACYSGHESIVLTLIYHGANVNIMDKNGITPLMIAARNGQHTISEILLFNQADIHATNAKNENALHFAAARGHEMIVQLLVEDGCSTTCISSEGVTASTLASVHSHSRIALMLERFQFRRSNRTYRTEKLDNTKEINRTIFYASKLLQPLFESVVKTIHNEKISHC
jgi:ankyrin repeat protein